MTIAKKTRKRVTSKKKKKKKDSEEETDSHDNSQQGSEGRLQHTIAAPQDRSSSFNRELVLTARDEILSHTRVLASLSCGIRVLALDTCDEGVMVLFEQNLGKDHANNNADEEDEELGLHAAERHNCSSKEIVPDYLTEDDEFFSPFPDVKQDFASAIPNSEKGIPNPAQWRKGGSVASHEVCTGRVRRRGEPSSQQTRAENSGTAVVDKGKAMFSGQKSLKLGHNRKNPLVIEDAALDAVELESGQDLTDKINDSSDTIQDLDEEEVRLKLREIELQRQEVALKLQLRGIQKKKQWSGGV
ncbi:hypothetical protein IWX49DRAFT_599696 [Phyllosticta citricarpa]|uniref:Uncharacterized protein n=1 Tax=Phyllosticta citricarpa TaxID=55181 RepID=A0ABR1LFV6_9PEZI